MERMPTIEDLQAMAGRELYRVTSPPVALSDIRKHAIAVYWPDKPPRRFWDEDYARQTPWGGIVAPEDFNPFAWPIEGPGPCMWARPRLARPIWAYPYGLGPLTEFGYVQSIL